MPHAFEPIASGYEFSIFTYSKSPGLLSMPTFGGAIQLASDVAAHQIAKLVNRRIRDAVVSAIAATFAGDQCVLGQQAQVTRNVGRAIAAQLGQFANVALLLA